MIKATDCILVMGRRGCGKSYLAKKLQELWPRRFIFDPLLEYQDNELSVYSFHEFCEIISRLKAENKEQFELIIKFDVESEVSISEFNEMLRLCYYFGNAQIVIEEIQNFSSPHDLPHWLRNCLLTGRHQNIALLFTTQRPGELNKTILSQCSHIFCGSIVEGNDLRYISGFLRQDAQKLINLPDRRFIYFGPHGISEINNDLSSAPLQHIENTDLNK